MDGAAPLSCQAHHSLLPVCVKEGVGMHLQLAQLARRREGPFLSVFRWEVLVAPRGSGHAPWQRVAWRRGAGALHFASPVSIAICVELRGQEVFARLRIMDNHERHVHTLQEVVSYVPLEQHVQRLSEVLNL